MNIFKRIFRIGTAESHAAVDKLEDPINMTEQGIRELKEDLEKAMMALAEIKALAIRTKSEADAKMSQSNDYEHKAMLLIKKGGNGEMDSAEADRLATESLLRKKECLEAYGVSKGNLEKHETSVNNLETNVKRLKSDIAKWESELKTLTARAKVSKATKNINKQMANIDSSSTVSMLERMKEKVAQEEALAQSYGEMANEAKSIDEEIDKALGDTAKNEVQDELAALKEKMNTKKEEKDQN